MSKVSGLPLAAGQGLPERLAAALRGRIDAGEWRAGDKLPSEAEISAQYQVARSTVRTALHQLKAAGLVHTRHGSGTYVTSYGPAIRSGLQELRSMTDTIAAHGMSPLSEYHATDLRPATEEEAAELGLDAGDEVWATQRAVKADGRVVAFSYEAMPTSVLPRDVEPSQIAGSLFKVIEAHGAVPRTAVATIDVTTDPEIGWGRRAPGHAYLLLRQTHFDDDGVPLVFARTYFWPGRFQFSILRTR